MRVQETHINVSKGNVVHYAMFATLLFSLVVFYTVFQKYHVFAQELVPAPAEESTYTEAEHVRLFPGKIESDTFGNATAAFSQDLSDNALFGDFNESNSAFIHSEEIHTQKEQTIQSEIIATGTAPTVSPEEQSATTSPAATSTEDVSKEETSGTSSAALQEGTGNNDTQNKSLLDTVVDFFVGDGGDKEGTSTNDQSGAAIEAVTPEETASSTPETDQSATSTGPISRLWGVMKHVFSTFAVAQVGTTTNETSTTTTEEVPDKTSTTTPENSETDLLSGEATSTEPEAAESATSTGTTTSSEIETATGTPESLPETKPEENTEPPLPADTEAPVLVVQGNDPAYLDIGDEYNDLGAIIPDVADSNLDIRTFVNGVEVKPVLIDTSTSSTYTITYQATDQAGNVGEAERIVYVGDVAEPETKPEEAVSETSTNTPSVEGVQVCEEGAETCVSDEIEFSDFAAIDDLKEGIIQNAQLRFSLAARPESGSAPEDEGIVIEYYRNGEWEKSGVIPLNEEVSNAVNGGYFLYALPVFESWSELEDLRVRITYESKTGNIGSVYLDSLWLEVEFTGATDLRREDTVKKEATKVLRKTAPEGYHLEFLTKKKDFSLEEEPTFAFDIKREDTTLLKKIGTSVKNFFGLNKEEPPMDVRVVDEEFKDLASVSIENGEYVLHLKKPRSFKPGKHTVTIEVNDGGNTFYVDQEFTWGVLAINANKSIYLPDETAYLQMGVLDDQGHTICDAVLDLTVTDPLGNAETFSTTNGTITYGDECAGDSFTTTPDYFTYYQTHTAPGVYRMDLTATTENGTRAITDTFEVRDEVPFDIERTGPTRIYPPELYPVTLHVTANEDYSGEVIERVPRSFYVSNPGDTEATFRTHEEGDVKELIWDVELEAGEAIDLSYQFDAPDVSPEFYLLGPLSLESFAEIRQWQIASDAVSFDNSGGNTGTTITGFNIGSAGTNRLVAVFAADESTGTNLSGVTVDSNACNLVTIADNNNGLGNHQELWYCDEDDLGSSNGSVNIAATGGDAQWSIHAYLFTNVTQNGQYDSGIDNTSAGINTATVNNIDSPESGLVIAGWGEGTDGLTESAQTSPLVTQLAGPDPNSADLFTGYGIESLPQTNKTYQFTFSGNHNRATGIVASWEPIRTTTVSANGNQISGLKFATTSAYIGGSFVIVPDIGTTSVTSVTITENGTVDAANDLDNIELYYELDTSAPYDCASETFDYTESQFGSTDTDGFSGANGDSTFTDSVAIASTSALCLYPVLDVGSGASIGETIELEINDANGGDVVVSDGEVAPGTAVQLSDTTVLNNGSPPETPTLEESPTFESMLATTTTPVFDSFSAVDIDGDDVEYEFIIDDDYDLSSPATTTYSFNYSGDPGWSAATFTSGATTTYQLQASDALTSGTTYWWAVRARDPSNTNTWSATSTPRSITISASKTIPEWYQTYGHQFGLGTLTNTATTTGDVEIDVSGVSAFDQTDTFNSFTGNPDCSSRPTYGNWTAQNGSDGNDGWSTDPNTTGSGGTGPSSVYDGAYLYLESSADTQTCGDNTSLSSTQTIESNVIDASLYALNFQFYYNMTGPAMDNGPASLHVDAWNGSSWDMDVTGSAIQSGQQTSWTSSGVIDLSGYTNSDFQVRLRYVVSTGGNVYENDVAVDDLHIYGDPRPKGTIMSPEIDHDWVPNQDTWGEVEWNTTEPTGSDVLLRVYYTSSTACDTIVPDGALAGNSSGFDLSDSPLNISGLSTSTYNRICLQAELDQGSAGSSPTLDDWDVRWTLTPQFTQTSYKWYANEDAEPPTDPWPEGMGESELGENDPITSSIPTKTGDVLRLRMSVFSTSTAATSGDHVFSLQYAEGSSCSTLTDWSDVGAIGSTTAPWRGYDNGSVSDGATLSSTTLSTSDEFESYEEENDSAALPTTLAVGETGEWDWVLENNLATPGVSYCFRMVEQGGFTFKSYTEYPLLVTNDSPDAPTLSKLFDNEKTASTSPWFEFSSFENEGEDVHYQIQVSTDNTFSSTVIDANSISNPTVFSNLDTPSDKEPYTHNQTVRFTATTTLSNNTTYWWRARAKDPNGSNMWGDWSELRSFTVDTSVSVSTWFQTTLEQFETDDHMGTDATTTDRITPLVGSTTASSTSSAIDFDWATVGNAWGTLSWNDSTPGASSITYHLEYYTSTSSWALIPDADLASNESGLSSPVDLIDLNTATYNIIRIRADFVNDDPNIPALLDWTLEWGERVSVPTHGSPFDNEKFSTTSPEFTFTSSDPQGDDLQYQVSWSTDNTFTSSTTRDSNLNPTGFENTVSPADTDPFTSGNTIRYHIQPADALTASTTYWWRVRAKDPGGANSWSFWSSPWSFTTGSSTEVINASTWFQDTEEQFDTDTLSNTVASTSDRIEIPSAVSVSILDAFSTGNTKSISAGSNRLLLVSVQTEDSGTSVNVNTVTYGGQLLTEIDDEQVGGGYSNGTWVGYLDETGIAAASGNTIVPTYAGGTPDNGVLYSSVVLENVDQTDPIGQWSGNTNTNVSTIQATSSISVSEGDMSVYFTTSGANGETHTPAANYTEGTEEDAGGNAHVAASAYRAITADGSEQPIADWTNSINRVTIVSLDVQKALTVTSGTARSSAIDFDDGDGPGWDEVSWNDGTPGGSNITYQVEYFTSTSSWALIPDSALSGNSSGFGTSPIDISGLNPWIYNTIRLVANFSCSPPNCPDIEDWTVKWAEGITVSGTAEEYDQSTNLTSGTVAVAVNGELKRWKTGTISAGVWSIPYVNVFPGQSVTVFIDGAPESSEAVGVTKYDGTGDITGMELFERHLSIGSDDNATTTNADLSLYDSSSSGDEDIFFDVDAGNDLTAVSTDPSYEDVELYIQSGDEYRPDSASSGNVEVHDLEINGELVADSNTIRVIGSWDNQGGFDAGNSTVIFTATTTTETIDSTGAATSSFNSVTFGETLGAATWELGSPLDVNGNATISYGTLFASTSTSTYAGNFTISANGAFQKGTATTTFDGSVAKILTDNTTSKQDLGIVVIDGTSKTLNLGSDIALTDLTIGSNDTLNVTNSNHDIEVLGNWTNNNVFTAQQGEVVFATTSLGAFIDVGSSNFYDLTFRGNGGGWSFVDPDVTVSNDLTVASGTVMMAVGTTTVGGSLSTTDTFVHNNGTVLFTSTGAETIVASTSAFYNLSFNGSGGTWAMNDANATSSHDVIIYAGTPTFPSGVLSVGNGFSNSDAFVHNGGTLRMFATDAGGNTLQLGGSDLHTLLFDGSGGSFSFTDTNATTTSDVVINAGTVTFPTGILSIQGSFANTDTFANNSGTVRFSATTTGKTIDAGASSFSTVVVDGTTGGWTIPTAATTTSDFTLLNANTFIVSDSLEVGGVFTNVVGGANTTWTGSTLYLNSGTDYAINTKTAGGDSYGTLMVGADTDIDMWNSTSTVYSVDSSGSLYSQDHNATDGELYIFGDYQRASGADYWSADTDFDGTDLAGGSERQVDVLFAPGGSATYLGGTLEILGTSTATTTVNNQGTGDYSIVVGGSSTVDAQYYAFRNLDATGLVITGTPTVTSLADGDFELAQDSGSTITVGDTALDANPLLQIQRVRFATTTLITGSNVTATGTPSSFWWFRNHTGNLAGEDFDTDPGGNPGNIRWDDSLNSINISGFVYADESGTVSSACGAGSVVTVVVDGGNTYTGSCAPGDGSFTISGVGYIGDPVITVYLDTDGGEQAVTVTKTPTVDITDMYLYEHRVIVREEDVEPLGIADMAVFDNADDSDILFTAATGSPDTLTVEPDTELHIWTGKTFIPGGNITLDSGGSGNVFDGTLHAGTSTNLTFADNESHSIGGSLFMDTTTVFDAASTTLTFTATTTGKIVAATSTLEQVVFNGSGGEWTIASSTTINGDITMTDGTILGTADVTVLGGDVLGDGDINMTGGTFTVEGTGMIGGGTDWTFSDLTLGDGSTAATTTKTGSGGIEAGGVLTIDTNHTLDAGTSTWTLSGGGTPFVINGTFDADLSLFAYTGSSGTDVTTTTYHDLLLAAAGGGPTYSILGGTLLVDNGFTVGDGTNAVTVNSDTFDPTITIGGTTTINQNGTLVGSNTNTLTVGASWLDYGTFTHANGTVLFDATTTGHTIEASTSPFFNVDLNSSSGGWTVLSDATSTNNFNITDASSFTLAPGATLEVDGQFYNGVGGANTAWTGSTLYLNSGNNYTVNTSVAGDDTYGGLLVGDDTDVRFWNSDFADGATTSPSGSVYSQDHAGANGDLYIWGDYVRSTGSDYWSYATDFDGTDISGSPRQAHVYLADNATTTLSGNLLQIIGSPSASTTIQSQGSGTYALAVNGGTLDAQYYVVRDINENGIDISGSPTISELSNGDFLLEIDAGTMLTVSGSAINANTGSVFSNDIFATSSGVNTGYNVTAPDASVGSLRFTTYGGNYGGEDYDNDFGGDPGYIIWDDSDTQITVSGTVYTDEGNTTAGGSTCNGSNQTVALSVNGAAPLTTSCNGSGDYSFTGIVFAPGDVLTVYLDADTGATFPAATVTVDPLTSITNMDLYQDRVIVRHEDTDPITNADLAVCDSDVPNCDTDIPFNVSGGDLTTDAGIELHVWDGKTFAPGGNITLNGNAGAEPDGTLHVGVGSSFVASGTETHTIAGSLNMLSGATLDPATSTFIFTASTTGKIISATSSPFYDLTFNGSSGAWSFPPNVVDVENDLTITAGTVTLGTATTSVGGSFDNTGGSFVHNNGLVYLATTTAGHTIEAGGSSFYDLTFEGSGGEWTWADTNATTSNDFTVLSASTTLPSGVSAVGGSFDNTGGVVNHPSGTLRMFSSAVGETFRLDGSNINDLTFDGTGDWTFADENATSTGDLSILQGSVTMASGTTAVAGSFDNTGGNFDNATGTVRLYGTQTGKTIEAGDSLFHNLIIDGATGGWTVVGDATTTNTFELLNADTFSASGFIESEGEFTNLVGGASTTWTGSTLYIRSGTNYSVNTKTAGGDSYESLIVGETGTSTDLRFWDSTSTLYTTVGTSSIYSQDHNGADGDLYIFGQYERSSGTDYWSYATDFDGVSLGSPRQVNVYMSDTATTTLSGGALTVAGDAAASTTIQNQGTGHYGLQVTGGTLNASYYQIRDANGLGLNMSGSTTVISSLSNGDFELSVEGGTMFTVASSTIDNNAALAINNSRFATSSGISSGYNGTVSGTAATAWNFNDHYGNYDGEAYDNDGGDDCGALRWDDSSCLFVSQEHYRWRNDDGGEAVPTDLWYNASWSKRQKITFTDTATTTTSDLIAKITVPYDADMQVDFDDLRFTDSSGTTTVDFWKESYTASTEATFWVKIPQIASLSTADIYMYYGNATAIDGSSGTSTFLAFDDFEDNDLSEYEGDLSSPDYFETSSSFNYEGSYGLGAEPGQESQQTTDGIYGTTTPLIVSQGQTIRFFQYVVATSDDEPCFLFGVQDPGTDHHNYAVCLDPFDDNLALTADVSSDNESGTTTELASTPVTYSTGWYEVEVGWQTDGTIDVNVYDGGSPFASITGNDTTYTSGAIGFSFWAQHGGWDLVTARQYVAAEPTYSFGLEQQDSGATWAADEDTALTGQNIDTNLRLRFDVNNSGAPITNQNFRLEFAPKGSALSCEAVPSGNFSAVPTYGSCGASAACMSTSTHYTNLSPTTELLSAPSGSTFTYGQIIENPSNQTGNIDVDTDEFTEVEYTFQMKSTISDSRYCFRTTDAGTALDDYGNVAELSLVSAPIITNYTLNGAQDITLVPGATTTVYATGTVIDLNGYSDFDYATTSIYRSGVGTYCTDDDNNCYQVASTSCAFSMCSGNSCELACYADMWYLADPTDQGTYSMQDWLADITIVDKGGEKDTGTTLGVDVLTLRAITASSSIPYGSLYVGSSTENYNATTTITNIGNDILDLNLSGSNLTFGPSSIPVANELYATSSFTYSTCGTPPCTSLSTTPTAYEVDLGKPTSTTTPISDDIYWGIYIPNGTAAAAHEGINTFEAIGD